MSHTSLEMFANSVVKSAGLAQTFDANDLTHIHELRKFAKRAQDTCVENWHAMSHAHKVAARASVRQAFGTLRALEKWAAVLEKTAAMLTPLPPEEEAGFRRALADKTDPAAAAFRSQMLTMALAGGLAAGVGTGTVTHLAAQRFGAPAAVQTYAPILAATAAAPVGLIAGSMFGAARAREAYAREGERVRALNA